MVSGLAAFFTVSGRVVVVRRTGCFVAVVVRCVDVVVDRVGVLRAAGLVLVDGVAAVDSRDDDDERAADWRLGLEVEQAAKPINKSPARRILDMSPPTAKSLGAK